MQFFPSLLFGISASLDALLVGISYGLRGVRIKSLQNLFISLVSLLGTCLSVCLGSRLLLILPASLADRTGSIILMLLGTYYIAKWTFGVLTCRKAHPAEIPHSADVNQSVNTEITSAEKPPLILTAAETLILSLTLSVNNIGIGLSASMAGLFLLPAAVMTFLCSALFLFSGNRLGQSRLLRLIGYAADPLSGLLLIGLGIIQLIF